MTPSADVSGIEVSSAKAIELIRDHLTRDFVDVQLNLSAKITLRLVSDLLAKRFLILTGLSGSGKTKVTQAFSRWITPQAEQADPFAVGANIKSDRVTYLISNSDALSVEFWNSEDEENATKVVLPKAMIEEWATHIKSNGLSRETPAREIREAVKTASKFSDQLHSFETHLKAAAFALVEAGQIDTPVPCYRVVPVGADWTGNENILGYPNGLDSTAYVTTPALDLILHARDHRDVPHFLILDELNLSHVERYFADVLSAIESEEPVPLHRDGERTANGRVIPSEIVIPDNLFIIGTVNVDETTYMFSPKVLDRANVMEFRMDAGELEAFLGNPAKPDLSKLDGKGAGFGTAFVEASRSPVSVPEDAKEAFEQEILLFFNAMQGHGAEFGYRVAYEAARFVHFYKLLGNAPDDSWFSDAFDCVIVQKLLPKLHGSRAQLGPLLKTLWFLCVKDRDARGTDPLAEAQAASHSMDKNAEPSTEVPANAPYPLSAEKIARMWRLLRDNGFASFAEA